METFRVELYNEFSRYPSGKLRGPFNAWGVGRYVDGRRTGWVVQFGRYSEREARELAAWLSCPT